MARVVGGRDNSKHRGSIAEMQFMLDAAKRGFGVAKPFADNERYDVIVDAPERLWRVQVKISESQRYRGYGVRTCWGTPGKLLPYTPAQIDFMAVVIQGRRLRGRIWYLIPVEALEGRLGINLYPFGSRKVGELRFEGYLGAWWLLGEWGGGGLTAGSSPGLRPRSE